MDRRPEITISSVDEQRLQRILDTIDPDQFPGFEELVTELERATIVDPHEVPADVVTMNSTVRFAEEGSGKAFTLTLVYPHDTRAGGDTVSILAPVGSALLGLRSGSHIDWPRPGGGTLSVRIDEIVYQPERAGEFHR